MGNTAARVQVTSLAEAQDAVEADVWLCELRYKSVDFKERKGYPQTGMNVRNTRRGILQSQLLIACELKGAWNRIFRWLGGLGWHLLAWP